MPSVMNSKSVVFVTSRQKRFRVEYDGIDVGEMIVDLLVEDQVIVELKAQECHTR